MTEIEKAMAAKVRAAKMLKEAQDEMDICEAIFKYVTNKANISWQVYRNSWKIGTVEATDEIDALAMAVDTYGRGELLWVWHEASSRWSVDTVELY